MTVSSAGLGLAKVGAVVFAVAVGGFYVVRAQREANPEPPAPVGPVEPGEPVVPVVQGTPAAPATPVAAESAQSAEAAEVFLYSSKALVIDPPALEPATTASDPGYLFGSKSGVFVPPAPTPQPGPQIYMGSSKSLAPGSTILAPPKPPAATSPKPPQSP